MATPNTHTKAGMAAEIRAFYDMNLLERIVANLKWTLWGQPKGLPKGHSSVKFRKFSSLDPATTALTEGVTPDGNTVTVSEISASPTQHGDYLTVSDVLDFEAIDPVLVEFGEILGDQAGQTYDVLTRDVVCAGTNVMYAGDRVSRVTVADGDLITATLLRKAVRTMKVNKIKKLTRMLNASTGVGTQPVPASFIGLAGPMAEYTIKQLSGFRDVSSYADPASALPDEFGSFDEIRFIRTDNPKVFSGAGAAGIDVHATIILGGTPSGSSGYGVVEPKGVENIIKDFGAGEDALNQRATTGWKGRFCAVRLEELAILRIEHDVEA